MAFPLPHCYRQLLEDARGRRGDPPAAALVASYRYGATPDGGAAPTPAALLAQTFTLTDRQPVAFLTLVVGRGGRAVVRILHRLMQYYELPGTGDAADFNDKILGLLGDIRHAQCPVVEVAANSFYLVGGNGARVPTDATMLGLIEALEPAQQGEPMGPYLADDAGTELVKPRHIQVLPNKYASILVHRDGVSPQMAYQELRGAFEADDMLIPCTDVLSWLRVASTARGGIGEHAGRSAVMLNHPLVLLPEAVSEYVARKVQTDLPSYRGLLDPNQPAAREGRDGDMVQLLGAVQQMAETLGGNAALQPRPAGRGEQKSVDEVYKETYGILLRFGQVDQVAHLAPIWSRLANCAKGEQQSVLQQELTKVCLARGLAPELYCPVVTTGVKQMVTTFQFAGHGGDDLTSGCQPFLVSYTGSGDYYRAQDTAAVAVQLDQGSTNASLADIRELRSTEKVKMPKDLHQVSLTLQQFAVLVHTLFQGPGNGHTLVQALWLLANTFQAKLPLYLERYREVQGGPMADHYPAHILRFVQISVQEYFQAVQIGGAVLGYDDGAPQVPQFHDMLVSLQRGSFHTSNAWIPLPPAYTTPPATQQQARGGTRSATGSANTTVSGLTVAPSSGSSSTGGGTGGNTATQTFVANPTSDPEFANLTLRPQMRELLRANPPPLNDAGTEFCVSWWGKGGCFSNCGRRATHRDFVNAGERTRLLNHVRAHLLAPPAGAAPAVANHNTA
jgi:hypothetical protein